MAEVIRMPRMSDTMEEGVIASWLVKEGDTLKSGDVIAEVETDKATMELDNYVDGILLHIGVQEGDAVPIDGIIAIVGEKGESIEDILKAEKSKPAAEAKDESPKEEATAPISAPASSPAPAVAPAATPIASNSSNGRIKASPLAKSLAKENGIDISAVIGSGDEGRIIKRDIEAYLKSGGSQTSASGSASTSGPAPIVNLPQVVGTEQFREEKVSQMRKTIAKRLSQSKFGAPHFYLTMDIRMDKAIEARKGMNEVSPVKISFNDMVIKAAAVALRQNPAVNSSWLEDRIRYNEHINIGMAVGIDDGLMVPVIRFADNKTLSHIAAETRQLAGKARDKNLSLDEMQGNTFTISNLGMFGIDEFTAIINPPDSCILAVGGIRKEPVWENDTWAPANKMKVTLSCDHRVVDGVVGSKFLMTLRDLLEDPVRMMV